MKTIPPERIARRIEFEIARDEKHRTIMTEISRNLPRHTARLESLHRSKYVPHTVGPQRKAGLA